MYRGDSDRGERDAGEKAGTGETAKGGGGAVEKEDAGVGAEGLEGGRKTAEERRGDKRGACRWTRQRAVEGRTSRCIPND